MGVHIMGISGGGSDNRPPNTDQDGNVVDDDGNIVVVFDPTDDGDDGDDGGTFGQPSPPSGRTPMMFGAYIASISTSIGWGGQGGTCQLTLVEDPPNGVNIGPSRSRNGLLFKILRFLLWWCISKIYVQTVHIRKNL